MDYFAESNLHKLDKLHSTLYLSMLALFALEVEGTRLAGSLAILPSHVFQPLHFLYQSFEVKYQTQMVFYILFITISIAQSIHVLL